MSRRHRLPWICWLLEHDFQFDDAVGYAAHCTRCGEGWGTE